ncbi:hypothetical protein J7M22_03335 [Candidatus Poribacteria bacterium]|nr:hypothetical protein [Candidatus Poribacteria bacterium]
MELKIKVKFLRVISYLIGVVLPTLALAAAVSETAQDKTIWRKLLDFINDHTLLSGAIFVVLTTIVTTIFSLIRKDKCLKKLRGKFVRLQLRNEQFYDGIFRLETTGIEIVSEKLRVEGKEASFLLSGKWKDQVHAFVRYHDVMLEHERQERDNELEKVYHPRLAVRLRRKIKVAFNTLKNALNQILTKIIGQVKSRFKAVEAQKFIEETSREALEYTVETVYDRLIDRLVGTKVVVAAGKQEYEGVLADYTNEWIELMEVNYRDYWEFQVWERDRKKGTAYIDPHGLKFERQGDKLIIYNRGPFRVQLQKLGFRGRRPNVEWKIYKFIEPFGKFEITLRPVAGVVVSPFEDVKTAIPIPFHEYQEIKLSFETHRMADITMPRGYASIRHRSEKYEPKLLSLSTLTEMILSETPKDFLLTDKDGHPLKYINIRHGYVTNLEENRMDVKEIAHAYARRWEVERLYEDADSRLRPLGKLLGNGNGRIKSPRTGATVAQMALLKILSLDRNLRRPKPQILYFPLAFAGKGKYKGRSIGMPVKVLMLTGNVKDLEFAALQRVKAVGNRKVILQRTKDKKLPRLDKSHILWISYAEISDERYRFNYDIEKRIKSYVANGGVVIAMGQKSRPRRSCRTTWLPEPIVGRKSDQIQEFDAESQADNLFQKPNKVKSGHLVVSDPWIKWSDNYEVLATVKLDGQEAAAILKLEYGDGMFIVTALKNETPDNIKLNAPIMENLIHYAVEWLNRKQKELKKERRWVA